MVTVTSSGSVDRTTFDPRGHPIRREVAPEIGAEPRYTVMYQWEKDSRTLTRRESGERGVTVSRFDEDGRMVEERREDGEARVRHREVYEYDETGRLVKHRIDEGGDGWDYGSEYIYDGEGRLVKELYGAYMFEWPERQWDVSYSDDGPSAEVVRSRVSDRRVHSRHALTYDADGRLIGEEYRPERAGDPWRLAWKYDVAGRLIQLERNYDSDNPSTIRRWEYDDAGRATRETLDNDADGVEDEVTVLEYDCSDETAPR